MANNNQNTQQPKKVPITISGYSQAVQDMMRAKHPDYDQVMNQGMQGVPNGQIPAVAPQPASMNFFQPNGGAVGKYEAPAVQPQPVQPVQPVQTGEAPVTDFTNMPQQPTGWNADGTPSYDSLSSALSGAAASQKQEAPAFQSDPSKKDGGFFGWLGSLIPKKRPGMREGETPEEYDRRRTRNMEMMTTLADAMRHIGNIVNTSKGAPLQQFNDPTAMMEQGYQNRKAQRQKEAALDADAAYKQANLSLKERAANAQNAYRELLLGMRNQNNQLARDKFDYRKGKDDAAAQYKQQKDQRDFEYKQGRDKVKDEQTNRRLSISQYNATHKGSGRGRSGGGGGSSAKYVTWDAEGKPHYASNKTMYEANEAYYNGNTSGNSSTSSSKEVFNRDGSTTRTTNRQSGSSVAQRAGALRRQREEARKRASKPTSKKTNKKGGWASGLKF